MSATVEMAQAFSDEMDRQRLANGWYLHPSPKVADMPEAEIKAILACLDAALSVMAANPQPERTTE